MENIFEDRDYLLDKQKIEGELDDELDALQNEVISFMGNFSLTEYDQKLIKGIIKKPAFQINEIWNTKERSSYSTNENSKKFIKCSR